ncbi:transposase [Micromonospora sp. LZ34]
MLPRHPPGLGRQRLRRQARRLGRHPPRPDRADRRHTRRADHLVVLHRRWAVERTFSWINRCRRTVRDYERLLEHHAAMVQWAMIIVMARRLARHQHTETLIYQALRCQ